MPARNEQSNTLRVLKQYIRLPRQVVESCSLKRLRTYLDMVLYNLL